MKKILILGVNGFIGHHLSNRILADTDWSVYGMDMSSERVEHLMDNPRFKFFEGDITINREWIEYNIRKCDVILPLVAMKPREIIVIDGVFHESDPLKTNLDLQCRDAGIKFTCL